MRLGSKGRHKALNVVSFEENVYLLLGLFLHLHLFLLVPLIFPAAFLFLNRQLFLVLQTQQQLVLLLALFLLLQNVLVREICYLLMNVICRVYYPLELIYRLPFDSWSLLGSLHILEGLSLGSSVRGRLVGSKMVVF